MVTSAERAADDEFAALYRREVHVMAALASSLTGSAEHGADLAQEAMTRAYRSWDTVRNLDRPGAWVRRVVINLAIDAHRRRESEERTLRRVAVAEVAPEPVSTSEEFWSAVRSLPDRQRAVIALHYIDDIGVDDIASVLGVAIGTVKAALHHGRRALAQALGTTEVAS